MNIAMPVLNVQLIEIGKVEANDYNPNKVAPPEMKLLKESIMADGYTQPIVVFHDITRDKYILIDGYHRYRCAIEYFKLDKIPATIIDKPLSHRMASTIRHNRARGTHQVGSMSDIILKLEHDGWGDGAIAKALGMDADEIIRLKYFNGMPELYKDHEFSRSWVEYEEENNHDTI